MSTRKKKTDLTKKVMVEIRQKHLKMRPKIYFVIGSTLLGFGLSLAVLLAIFFTNLLFFKLRTQNPFVYLPQGRMGLKPFIYLFPWQPLLVAVLSIVLGLFLLRRYDLSYKKPFRVLVLVIIGIVFLMGILLNLIKANERVKKARRFRRFYRERIIPSPFQRFKRF